MQSTAQSRRSWGALALAIALFALGFAVANRFQLTTACFTALAANDWPSAAGNFLVLAVQALALLAAIALLGRKLFIAAMALAFVSILVNLGYGQTVNDVIGAGTVAWMTAETRQAGNVAGEFAAPLLLAGAADRAGDRAVRGSARGAEARRVAADAAGSPGSRGSRCCSRRACSRHPPRRPSAISTRSALGRRAGRAAAAARAGRTRPRIAGIAAAHRLADRREHRLPAIPRDHRAAPRRTSSMSTSAWPPRSGIAARRRTSRCARAWTCAMPARRWTCAARRRSGATPARPAIAPC